MFVVPFSPTGTPATIKIKSPSLAKPAFLASSVANWNISSVDEGASANTGCTPQLTVKPRRVRSSNVTAKMSAFGRYLEIIRAVWPDFVAATIVLMFKFSAVSATERPIASVTSVLSNASNVNALCWRNAFSDLMSIRAIVATDSTG